MTWWSQGLYPPYGVKYLDISEREIMNSEKAIYRPLKKGLAQVINEKMSVVVVTTFTWKDKALVDLFI